MYAHPTDPTNGSKSPKLQPKAQTLKHPPPNSLGHMSTCAGSTRLRLRLRRRRLPHLLPEGMLLHAFVKSSAGTMAALCVYCLHRWTRPCTQRLDARPHELSAQAKVWSGCHIAATQGRITQLAPAISCDLWCDVVRLLSACLHLLGISSTTLLKKTWAYRTLRNVRGTSSVGLPCIHTYTHTYLHTYIPT